jgi:exodeoxyribonuclease VII small subunit
VVKAGRKDGDRVIETTDLTFEEAFQRLEAAVAELEAGSLTVEGMVERFEHGMALVALCRRKLDAAQSRVSTLVRELDPFESPGLLDPTEETDS